MSSPKLPQIVLTDELSAAIDQYLTKNRGITLSFLVREALSDFLIENGIDVKDAHPQRGGDRRSEEVEEK